MKKISIGFARMPDKSLSWCWFERTEGCCGCVIYWFACLALEFTYNKDCADYNPEEDDDNN